MTQDEIIEMWKNSGDLEIVGMPYRKIEAFAKLVEERTAAKERKTILLNTMKARNVDGNCDIVLCAEIRTRGEA